jgi:Flp pilus assembly protein TadD
MLQLIAIGVLIFLVGLVVVNYRAIMVDIIGHLVQSRPDDYTGWCYYGTLLDREGYYIEAYDAFKKAVTLSPAYTEAWKKMGDVLMKLGDSTGAAEAYRFSES